MWNVIKQIFVLALIAGIGYVLFLMAQSRAGQTRHFTPDTDGTITILGKVLTNDTSCFENAGAGLCTIQLQTTYGDAYVVYNTSDTAFCPNEGAQAAGRAAVVGDTIRVKGFYELRDGKEWVRTCPQTSYYIEKM